MGQVREVHAREDLHDIFIVVTPFFRVFTAGLKGQEHIPFLGEYK